MVYMQVCFLAILIMYNASQTNFQAHFFIFSFLWVCIVSNLARFSNFGPSLATEKLIRLAANLVIWIWFPTSFFFVAQIILEYKWCVVASRMMSSCNPASSSDFSENQLYDVYKWGQVTSHLTSLEHCLAPLLFRQTCLNSRLSNVGRVWYGASLIQWCAEKRPIGALLRHCHQQPRWLHWCATLFLSPIHCSSIQLKTIELFWSASVDNHK